MESVLALNNVPVLGFPFKTPLFAGVEVVGVEVFALPNNEPGALLLPNIINLLLNL